MAQELLSLKKELGHLLAWVIRNIGLKRADVGDIKGQEVFLVQLLFDGNDRPIRHKEREGIVDDSLRALLLEPFDDILLRIIVETTSPF